VNGTGLPLDLSILVTGAGGFLGGHLVRRLRQNGHRRIRGVDCKPLNDWFQRFDDVDNVVLDLREAAACREACAGIVIVFNLACDMGGIKFIEANKATCMQSVLINTHMLMSARAAGVLRFFYSSSACVYPADKQQGTNVLLKESDVYPAMPEDGYGWEKLFGERMCRHFHEDYGLETRVGRYHNVFGPNATYFGDRAKAPSDLARKVALAKLTGHHDIEIWGDGEQTRSFLFVDDCLDATLRLAASQVTEPLNIGSDRLISIDMLVTLLEDIAGVKLTRHYKRDACVGVRGRCSDNRLVGDKLGWQPQVSLEQGLEVTYRWIYEQLVRNGGPIGRHHPIGTD
jgi:GDP-D-mannose 3',5'-epimerase